MQAKNWTQAPKIGLQSYVKCCVNLGSSRCMRCKQHLCLGLLTKMNTGPHGAHSKWRTGLPSTGGVNDTLQKCPLDRNLCAEKMRGVITTCKHVYKQIRVQWFQILKFHDKFYWTARNSPKLKIEPFNYMYLVVVCKKHLILYFIVQCRDKVHSIALGTHLWSFKSQASQPSCN